VVVVADKQVKHGVTCSTGHGLNNLVGWWRNTGIANGDGIEGLEVMDKVQRTALLFDAEPVGAVGHIGVLMNSCGKLVLEDLDHVT
jgi:hypothetical protein